MITSMGKNITNEVGNCETKNEYTLSFTTSKPEIPRSYSAHIIRFSKPLYSLVQENGSFLPVLRVTPDGLVFSIEVYSNTDKLKIISKQYKSNVVSFATIIDDNQPDSLYQLYKFGVIMTYMIDTFRQFRLNFMCNRVEPNESGLVYRLDTKIINIYNYKKNGQKSISPKIVGDLIPSIDYRLDMKEINVGLERAVYKDVSNKLSPERILEIHESIFAYYKVSVSSKDPERKTYSGYLERTSKRKEEYNKLANIKNLNNVSEEISIDEFIDKEDNRNTTVSKSDRLADHNSDEFLTEAAEKMLPKVMEAITEIKAKDYSKEEGVYIGTTNDNIGNISSAPVSTSRKEENLKKLLKIYNSKFTPFQYKVNMLPSLMVAAMDTNIEVDQLVSISESIVVILSNGMYNIYDAKSGEIVSETLEAPKN